MKWKHTRARLASNIFCGAIIDEHTVFCVCGQKIVLDNDYDESRLIEYSKNSRCKLNNKKKQLGLPTVTPDPKNIKYTPKFYYNNDPLLSYLKNNHIKQLHNILFDGNSSSKEFWTEFSEKANEGVFEQKLVFKGLCYIMLQATEREKQDKEFGRHYRRISDNVINNPDLCYENVAHFKRLLDTLHYQGPVVAMTDCTKIKVGLQYSSSLGCIVGSTLNQKDCKIETYDNIYNKVSDIKQENAVAKYVRAYVLQVPLSKFLPIIVALILTRSDNSEKIFVLHKKFIDIAADLEIHIISIGSDGAAAEFQAQNLLQATETKYRLRFILGELIDGYLNRNITHHERIEMAMTAYFFLHLWKYHIETLSYNFNEYEEFNLLDNDLECLHYWPSDIEIDDTINIGYKRAIHLVRHLEINSILNDAYYFNIHKKFPNSQLEDFWNKDLSLETVNNDEYNMDCSLPISHCISNAISEMNRNQEFNSSSRLELPLEKIYETCQIIIERIQKLPEIPWFPNDSRSEIILDNDLLNIEFLLELHRHHDAHSEKNLVRIKFSSKDDNERNVLSRLNINKVSSLVSYLTKNNFILTKSRENRWKSGEKTSNNLIEKNQCYLCNNIALFPLRIGSFVIAKFDNTPCVAQIIAMYERNNLFHSYIDTPVSDFESLSYVSLKIFFHINGAIFSTICDHQFYIFSHVEPSHIVYYLASSDISINEEETKFSDTVLLTDSTAKTKAATASSNSVHDSTATEILPVKVRSKQWEEMLNLTMQGKLFGIHVPLRHIMERRIVSKAQRLPAHFSVLPSSNFGLEILM
ncbi:25038_t:CDS:10, partial [Racocetra persica]